jgi:hypothetical protein
MSSPFKTSKEFLEVKGPLYTFANNSVWLTFFLVLSVGILLWFIYASYQTNKSSKSSDSTARVMSVLLLTGFLSLAQSVYVSRTITIEALWQKNKLKTAWQKKAHIPSSKITKKTTRQNYYSYYLNRDRTIRRG